MFAKVDQDDMCPGRFMITFTNTWDDDAITVHGLPTWAEAQQHARELLKAAGPGILDESRVAPPDYKAPFDSPLRGFYDAAKN